MVVKLDERKMFTGLTRMLTRDRFALDDLVGNRYKPRVSPTTGRWRTTTRSSRMACMSRLRHALAKTTVALPVTNKL